MRWPFRYRPHPADVEGLERAKKALANAREMEVHADESARVHEDILRRNNLGPKIHRALGGQS